MREKKNSMPLVERPRPILDGGAPVRSRPFASPCHASGGERQLLLDCLESERWSSFRAGVAGMDVRQVGTLTSAAAAGADAPGLAFLGGRYVRAFEARFADHIGTPFAVAANSGTSALVMALGALRLGPGDEVLVPSMSFHATATSVLFFNSVPVFVEVEPETFCLDPLDAEAKITERTRAVVVVHLGGIAAGMDAILDLARRHSLKVIEDCAQALGSGYRGRKVGSLGDAGVFSLNEMKSITCGEGGVVVSHDPEVALRARLIRNHGEGLTEDSWPDEDLVDLVGMNFRLTELQAAVVLAQLDSLEERNRQRRNNALYLIERLRHHPELIPHRVENGADYACYAVKWRYLPRDGMPDRDALVRALGREGIPVVPGYRRLLHEHPLFSRRIAFGRDGCPFVPPYHPGGLRYGTGACPRSEELNRQLLWFLHVNPPNTLEDMDDVGRAFDKVLDR
jgi:perosamine synthetase